MPDGAARLAVGDVRTVTIGAMVHGGHALAHVDGQTIFVRYACPGEEVVVRITSASRTVVRADAVQVLTASPDRVVPPCSLARPGGCGGCDWQFASPEAQRRWKADVIRESFARFARLPDLRVVVEQVPGDVSGLQWRQRAHVTLTRGGSGTHAIPAFKRARSAQVIDFDVCPVLTPGVNAAAHGVAASAVTGPDVDAWIQEGSDDRVATAVGGAAASAKVEHRVLHRAWRIDPRSFWQAHRGLAQTLVETVLDAVGDIEGQSWWDLYAGSGLFSAFLGERVGASGSVRAVEESPQALREGRRALHDLPQVRLDQASTIDWLRTPHGPVDGIVLDPPRSGAGPEVVDLLVSSGARTIVYVACDPVALARDAALLASGGYQLAGLRAFDGFPMTHHVECVATFTMPEIS